MFFLYSKSCEYAVRALTAVDVTQESFRVEAVCRKAEVPEAYTRKAIERLASAGILLALRGRGGGYQFAVNPRDIPVLEVIKAIDGEEAFNQCVMGLPKCGNHNPCPLHQTWQGVKEKYLKDLERKSLGDLIGFSQRKVLKHKKTKVKTNVSR